MAIKVKKRNFLKKKKIKQIKNNYILFSNFQTKRMLKF